MWGAFNKRCEEKLSCDIRYGSLPMINWQFLFIQYRSLPTWNSRALTREHVRLFFLCTLLKLVFLVYLLMCLECFMCILEIVAALYKYTREPVYVLESIFWVLGTLYDFTCELFICRPFEYSRGITTCLSPNPWWKTQKDIFIISNLIHTIAMCHSLTKTKVAVKY